MQLLLNFLNNLQIRGKLGLISLAMAIPIAYTLSQYFIEKSNSIAFSEKERLGIQYLAPLRSVHRNMVRYRDLTNAQMRGATALQAQRVEAMSAVDKDLATVEALDQQAATRAGTFGTVLQTTSTLRAVQQKWSQLKGRDTGSAVDVFNEHTQMLQLLAEFIRLATDKSNLTLDPDEDTYYLMDLSSFQLPAIAETIGQLRGLGGGILAAKAITAEERAQIGFLQRQVEYSLTNFKNAFDKAQRANPVLRDAYAGRIEVEIREIRDYFNFVGAQLLSGQEVSGDVQPYFIRGAQLTDRLRQLEETVTNDLDKLLSVRINKLTDQRTFSLVVTLLGLLLAGLVTYFVTRSITNQTNEITSLIVEIEKGNFDQRIITHSNDELGRTAIAFNTMLDNTKGLMQSRDERDQIQYAIMKLLVEVSSVADGDLTAQAEVTEDMTGAIADAFNFMIVNLRELISKVKDVSHQVMLTTADQAQQSDRLAQDLQEQAERITQTSTALTEMSAQIVRVSQNAELSAQVAEQSLTTARKGSAAVQNTVQGMSRIQEHVQETSRRIRQLGERSQEIEEIVRLIRELSDRTGVLALNASIHAATADDAGHGFSIVATEVEHLAGRSAEAAKRISSLIRAIQTGTSAAIISMEEVNREVIRGVNVAHSAGDALQEIESVSAQVASLVRSISHATQQQARGSEALSRTMGQLAQLSNQTTTGVTQSALTIRNLAVLVNNLRASVGPFKVSEVEEEHNVYSALNDAHNSLVMMHAASHSQR